jgi:hypothetical protein
MVFARTHHLPLILSHMKAVHVLSSPLLKTHFSITFHVCLGLLSGFYVFLFSPISAICITYLFLLDLITHLVV